MENDFSGKLYAILSSNPIEQLFSNVRATIEHYDFNKKRIITTVTDVILPNNCYVVSPYALTISYSKIELHKVHNLILIFLMRALISFFSRILIAARIDKIQILNNYLFSTNFFTDSWEDMNVVELTRTAVLKHPLHTLAIRSVNKTQNPKLYLHLLTSGWLPVITRQVYVFTGFDFKKRDMVRDLELLKSERYIFVDPDINNFEHFKKAEELYNQLYLEKYTEENIQYTAFYIQQLFKNGLLHLKLLLDTKENTFVGVVGLVGEGRIVTAPIVGYETPRPNKEALYRRCLIYIIKYASDHSLLLNISSGAPEFKRNRGATPEIEYMMVNVKHLSFSRRLIWNILSKISLHIYRPILQTYKL